MPERGQVGSSRLPDLVGVVGGGRMGSGIAHAFLEAGVRVVVREQDASVLAAAEQRVRESLARASERGLLGRDLGQAQSALSTTTDLADLAGAGLVVEAVPEDPALKARVLTELAAAVPDAVLATNTSSLPIGELAASLAEPGRFVGLHFFNPVPASELVEVVVPSTADPGLAGVAVGWVRALGRTPIVVKDSPGFATSRLGVALALEAMRMVEDGVASAADVDTAMELGYRHQMGPLRTTDLVGLDVRLAIAEHLYERLGERFRPPQVLRDLVADGHLGRKSGRGFHDWSGS